MSETFETDDPLPDNDEFRKNLFGGFVSFDPNDMTEDQHQRYELVPVGEAFYSGRTTFRVTCKQCDKVIHTNTNGPDCHMRRHDEFHND